MCEIINRYLTISRFIHKPKSIYQSYRRLLIDFISIGVISIILVLVGCSHQLMLSNHSDAEVLLFEPRPLYGNPTDIETYGSIAKELGFKYKKVGYHFINREGSLLDPDGNIKFKVLILPGGEPYRWFEQTVGNGLSCKGVDNILKFVRAGGSIIGICLCSSALFVDVFEWKNPTLNESKLGIWNTTNTSQGWFKRFCGVEPPFKGSVRGPQNSNKPYPKTRFLPIRMNPENEIVNKFNLPDTIYQTVVGGGSLFPYKGEKIDVIGWFSDGGIAIGAIPYGKGQIILTNPHPNIAGAEAETWRWSRGASEHRLRWGWTHQMVAEDAEVMRNSRDPDGSLPDLALAKAMLIWAYEKASK
jgi:glutamine amidotransferase-like uncharacterized protein